MRSNGAHFFCEILSLFFGDIGLGRTINLCFLKKKDK